MSNSMWRSYRTLTLILAFSCATIMCEGCSSISVHADQTSKDDDTFSKTVYAMWWGIGDIDQPAPCDKGAGLQVVSMKTNWLYSICTFVTLGAVVPVDIEYTCSNGKAKVQKGMGAINEDRQ